jgi:hypothetical protein
MAIGAAVVIGLGTWKFVLSVLKERLTRIAEAKFGMGKHVWTVPPENIIPYFQVRLSKQYKLSLKLIRSSHSTPAFSCTMAH